MKNISPLTQDYGTNLAQAAKMSRFMLNAKLIVFSTKGEGFEPPVEQSPTLVFKTTGRLSLQHREIQYFKKKRGRVAKYGQPVGAYSFVVHHNHYSIEKSVQVAL